jgi:hypothetical protein
VKRSLLEAKGCKNDHHDFIQLARTTTLSVRGQMQNAPAPTTNDEPGAMSSLEEPKLATRVNRAPTDGEWSYGRRARGLVA